MPILLVILLSMFVSAAFPRAANVAAWIITMGFILPFFTFGGGTLIWGIGALVGHAPSWWGAVAFGGLPLGMVASWSILGD